MAAGWFSLEAWVTDRVGGSLPLQTGHEERQDFEFQKPISALPETRGSLRYEVTTQTSEHYERNTKAHFVSSIFHVLLVLEAS